MQLKISRKRQSTKVGNGAEASTERYAKGTLKREAILTGAMKFLADGTKHNPSLREIGNALDIEPAHILYYFTSRDELLLAVIELWDSGERELEVHARNAGLSALDAYVDAIARNVDRPGIVHLYLSLAIEAASPEHPANGFFAQRFDWVQRHLTDAVQREQAENLISPELDAEHEARMLIALADGLQLQSLVDPTVDAPGHLALTIDSLRRRKKA